MSQPNEVRVERRTIWNVVLIYEDGERREWPHQSEEAAVKKANDMVRKRLVNIRGEDRL